MKVTRREAMATVAGLVLPSVAIASKKRGGEHAPNILKAFYVHDWEKPSLSYCSPDSAVVNESPEICWDWLPYLSDRPPQVVRVPLYPSHYYKHDLSKMAGAAHQFVKDKVRTVNVVDLNIEDVLGETTRIVKIAPYLYIVFRNDSALHVFQNHDGKTGNMMAYDVHNISVVRVRG